MKRLMMLATMLAVAVGLTGCFSPVYKHRYRLTIAVDTPDGRKTGSSVIEVSAGTSQSLATRGSMTTGVQGEAVFVDLGRGRQVIALLAVGIDMQEDLFSLLVPMAWGRGGNLDDFAWIENQSGTVELKPKLIPTLITFDDIKDPSTASPVDPTKFEAAFGSGYRLASATIEFTNDAITCGIEKRLPWWNGFTAASIAVRARNTGTNWNRGQTVEGLFRSCKS